MILRRSSSLLALLLFAAATTAQAAVVTVNPGESIQAAINGASPGDTILVEPGTYQSSPTALYGLHITTDNLRLIGKVNKGQGEAGRVRILHNGAQETGVFAAPPGCGYKDTSCGGELQDFYIRGFTVEGFPQNGIQTRWVNGFKFVRNESVNNRNNGIYPTLSANGLVQNNVSYGSLDTAMWVAGSEDVRVIGNEVYGSPIGLEITVSHNVLVTHNDIHDNTIGVGLFHPNAAGNPPLAQMENWILEHNNIYDNNLPNPAPITSFQGALPPGGGVLLIGVSDHVIGKNTIENNDFFGISVLGWCTALSSHPTRNCVADPPIASPSADRNTVYMNELDGNGTSPPPHPLAFAASDIIYLQTPPFEPGTENCFEDNTFTTFFASPGPNLPTDGC